MDELFGNGEFWVAFAFVIFVAAIGKLAYAKITQALEKRAATIKQELDEAMRLREEAQALLAGYQRQQRDALTQAEEIVAHAHQEAARLATQAEKNLEEDMARRARLTLDKIAQAEAQALNEVRDAAAALAVSAARRLIASSLDEVGADKLIDDAIAELDGKLH